MLGDSDDFAIDRHRSVLVEHVTRALSTAADGSPILLSIQGDAGHGKSTVLDGIRHGLDQGGLSTLTLRGSDVTAEMPYGALYRMLVDESDMNAPRRLIAELSSFRATSSPLAIAAAVARWMSDRCAGRPMVLIADDADLVDEDSLRVLAYAAMRDASASVSILHTATRNVPLLDRLLVERHVLHDLSDADARALAERCGADASTATQLLADLGGNPLALVHAGSHGGHDADGQPLLATRLLADVQQRLTAQPPDTARILEAAAVTGTHNVVQLEALSVPCERGFEAIADDVERSGLAEVFGDELSWRRRWMRAAVAVQCPDGRRRRWAHRAAMLTAARASITSPFVDHREELTAAERRVVEVVVDGSNTREAASVLHLSEKTVESHLQRVYRKLGVHSRVQLAAMMRVINTTP